MFFIEVFIMLMLKWPQQWSVSSSRAQQLYSRSPTTKASKSTGKWVWSSYSISNQVRTCPKLSLAEWQHLSSVESAVL